MFVRVCAAAVSTRVIVPDGNVATVVAVDVSVSENAPEVANVEPCTNVRVAEVAGAVIVTLLTVVAVATPMSGVVRVRPAIVNAAEARLIGICVVPI